MEPAALRAMVEQDEELADYRHMVDDIIRGRAHVLSTREEQLMAMAAPAMEAMDNAFSMLESVDLPRGDVTDENGATVHLTGRRVRQIPGEPRPAGTGGGFRGDAHGVPEDGQHHRGFIRRAGARRRVRGPGPGLADSLEAALFSDALPRSIYTGLIEAVRGALPAYYEYLELRRRMLGVEELHIYDCYVPVVELPEESYTYEQARDLVVEQLAPLGETYRRDLETLLAGGWVDVYETAGKTTGAIPPPGFTGCIPTCCSISSAAGGRVHPGP